MGRKRIDGHDVRCIRRPEIGQRAQRQPEPDRRIPRQEEQPLAPKLPALRDPAPSAGLAMPDLDRQDKARWLIEAALEHPDDAGAFLWVFQLVVGRVEVERQLLLDQKEMRRVFVGRHRGVFGQPQLLGERHGENACVVLRRGFDRNFAVDALLIFPERLPIPAPIDRESPARQLLARIPLALAIMQKPARSELVAQAADEIFGIAALCRADGVGVPLRAVHVVDGDEGRLAAHGKAHIAGLQAAVHLVAGLRDRGPLFLGVGQRDARAFQDARHLHREGEIDLRLFMLAADRRGALRRRRRGERNMALAREQAGGRIEADPARARQIDFSPGVQVGKVVLGARRPVERFHVGLELDQVARHEPCREPEVAQDVNQKPARVAA